MSWLDKINMSIITRDTFMRILNDPHTVSVNEYTEKKDLHCYSVITITGERYKVFTHGKVL